MRAGGPFRPRVLRTLTILMGAVVIGAMSGCARFKDSLVVPLEAPRQDILAELRLILAEHGYTVREIRTHDLYARRHTSRFGPDDVLRLKFQVVEARSGTALILDVNYRYGNWETVESHGHPIVLRKLHNRLEQPPPT